MKKKAMGSGSSSDYSGGASASKSGSFKFYHIMMVAIIALVFGSILAIKTKSYLNEQKLIV